MYTTIKMSGKEMIECGVAGTYTIEGSDADTACWWDGESMEVDARGVTHPIVYLEGSDSPTIDTRPTLHPDTMFIVNLLRHLDK